MVTLGLLILFAVIVAISALVGLARGLSKAVIRILTLALAVVLTFVIAGPVTTLIAQSIQLEGMSLGEMILEAVRSIEMVGGILDSAPLMQEAILVAPAFVLSIVVFPLVFMVLSFVSWIVFLIVNKPLRKWIFGETSRREDAEKFSAGVRVGKRFAGLGVGIVTGVLIFGVIMTPVLGLFSILPSQSAMDETLNAMVEQNYLTAADAEMVLDAYAVTDSTLVNLYGKIGVTSAGRAYINSVSKIEADGQRVYLADEFNSLLAIVQTAVEGGLLDALAATEDQNALYALLADKPFMDQLMQDMFQSKLLCAAVPEVMAIAMESVATSMNVPANKEAVYNNMMDDVALAVKNAEIDYAGIKAYEEANATVYRLVRTATAERTNTATDIMTQEEYEAEIQKLAELTQAISAILNKAVSGDNVAFTDSIANHIVNEVKTQAVENGQNTLENFDAASVQTVISNVKVADIDAGEGDAGKLLEQLTDQEKFETDVTTVETIKESIRESVKSALADESKAAETAGTLSTVVSDFAGAVSAATGENGELDVAKLDFEKVASAVTSLQNSTLKDVGSSVLDIVASGDLGDNSLVSDVLGAVKEGYDNGEDIGGAIGTAGALINLGSAMSGNGDAGAASQEDMVSSLTSLINNLNDYTIGLLPSILSSDTIHSMGVPAEYFDATYSVIETLLKELMKLKGAEDYDSEVNAILSLYNLATTGVEQFADTDVADLVGYALKSDAIYNTLISISTSNPFGIQIQDEATRANLVTAIEDNYAQSGQTQRERNIYNAVATLLGLDAEVNLG